MTTTKKISELPDAGTLTGDEQIPLVQDGATRKTTVDDNRGRSARWYPLMGRKNEYFQPERNKGQEQ